MGAVPAHTRAPTQPALRYQTALYCPTRTRGYPTPTPTISTPYQTRPNLHPTLSAPFPRPCRVRGGASAVQQPVWSPDGAYLYFVDDAAAPGADAAKADPADPS